MPPLLQFAATSGQTPGSGVGQLPPGYLPLTAADGLGGAGQYTQSAATDVAAQNGQVPSLTAAASTTPTTAPAITPTFSGGGTGNYSYSGTPYSALSAEAASSVIPSVGGHGGRRLPPNKPASQTEPLFGTLGIALWAGGILVVVILGMAFLGMLGVPVTYLAGRRKGKW